MLAGAKLSSQNLVLWSETNNQHARQLLTQETPKLFLITPRGLDAQVDITRKDGSVEQMRSAQLARLSWTPADARFWSRFAIDLQRYGHTGETFEYAVSRALKLAPYSSAIALEQSIVAAYRWDKASTSLRDTWRVAFSTALRTPQTLVRMANQSHATEALCEHLTKPNSLESWCSRLPAYQQACRSDHLKERQAKWCNAMGF